MRIFDELNLEVQNEIVTTAVRYAKGEIAEFNLPVTPDVIALAVQYDTMFFTTVLDYSGLNLEVQNEIVTTAVRYAKGEIAEFNLPASTDVIALAVQYDTMYFTTVLDYSGLDLVNIPGWIGPRPIKRPA